MASRTINYGEFSARLQARKDRWSLLQEVQDEWGIVSLHINGDEPYFAPEVIAAAEAHLGFALPAALKEWYALPFRFHEVWSTPGSSLLPPFSDMEDYRLGVRDGFVSFHHEEQTCCEWGFRLEDAGMPDPPIYNGMDLDFVQVDDAPERLTWIPQSRSLSEWVIHRTLSDALGLDGMYAQATANTPEAAAALLRGFRPLGFTTQPWFQFRMFGGPNAIIETWPEDRDSGWEYVQATGPHPTVLPRTTWDSCWEQANSGPLNLVLFCRDEATLERIVSSRDGRWKLNQS